MNGKKEREVFVESIALDKSEIVMNSYRPNIEQCTKWAKIM